MRLHANRPNPFAVSTEIPFDLPQRARVTLALYDVLGREVARLLDGQVEAGRHVARWDASGLPSGTYACRLTVDGEPHVRILVVAR